MSDKIDEHMHRLTSIYLLRIYDESPWELHARVFVLIYMMCVNTSFSLLGTWLHPKTVDFKFGEIGPKQEKKTTQNIREISALLMFE